jgi:hypothetical protein
MLPDIAATPAERSEEAQRLMDQAEGADFVELTALSALELCAMGGPTFALFEEDAARAWLGLPDRRRRRALKTVTEGMVERGLLAPNPPGPDGETYSMNPVLGLILAARYRPTWIAVTETADAGRRRTPQLFALGDQEVPVRAVVVEEPAALPGGASFPNARKLGPLGLLYRYVLVSEARAAEVMAEWAIAPPPEVPGTEAPPARAVIVYRPADPGNEVGNRLAVRGDGSTARLLPPEDPGHSYDEAGLTDVMRRLIARAAR